MMESSSKPDGDPTLKLISCSSGNIEFNRILADLHRACFEPIDQQYWSTEDIEGLLSTAHMSADLICIDKQPVGFLLVSTVVDETEVISVSIHPEFEGRGLARKALGRKINYLRDIGISKIFLEVREDNMKAIQLYHSLNFTPFGRRYKYYQTMSGNKLDALIFSLIL